MGAAQAAPIVPEKGIIREVTDHERQEFCKGNRKVKDGSLRV